MKLVRPSLAALTVLALCGAPATQAANDRVAVALSDPSRPLTLHLALIQGSIEVRGTDRKDVLIESSVEDEEPRAAKADAGGLKRIAQPAPLSIEEENNRVAISAASPNRFYKIAVEVPARANLEISTINGGEITVDGVDGDMEVGNVNGGITLTRVAGSVVAHTTNGGVRAAFTRVSPQKPMAFTTLNGDVDISLPAATKANLRLRSDQGEIFTDFELKLQAGSTSPSIEDTRKEGGRYRIEINKALQGTINGGGPDFELRSFTGNIYVRDGSKK